MTQQLLFWASIWKIWKHLFAKVCAPLCSMQHYSQWQRHRNNQCPTIGDWIKKTWPIYTMEYYSVIRKDEELVTTWMPLENIVPSEVSQSDKAQNHEMSLTCGIWNGNQYTQTASSMAVTRGKGVAKGKGGKTYGDKMIGLWMVGTQWGMQTMCHRNACLKPMWSY